MTSTPDTELRETSSTNGTDRRRERKRVLRAQVLQQARRDHGLVAAVGQDTGQWGKGGPTGVTG